MKHPYILTTTWALLLVVLASASWVPTVQGFVVPRRMGRPIIKLRSTTAVKAVLRDISAVVQDFPSDGVPEGLVTHYNNTFVLKKTSCQAPRALLAAQKEQATTNTSHDSVELYLRL